MGSNVSHTVLILNRYGAQSMEKRRRAEEEYENAERTDIEQAALIPGTLDPKLFLVKARPGLVTQLDFSMSLS